LIKLKELKPLSMIAAR